MIWTKLINHLFPEPEPVDVGPYLRLLRRITACSANDPYWCGMGEAEFGRMPLNAAKAGLIRMVGAGMWAEYWELTRLGRVSLAAYEAAAPARV